MTISLIVIGMLGKTEFPGKITKKIYIEIQNRAAKIAVLFIILAFFLSLC